MRKHSQRITAVVALSVLASLASASEPRGSASLVYLDLTGKVMQVSTDGGATKVLVDDAGRGPDGVAVDERTGHIYWTTMGKPDADDGTIMRADANGMNSITVVPAGGTFTPKQLKIDSVHGKLYWSDREGMRVMRANLDGSKIETLVVTGNGDADRKDQSKWCVGIAVDTDRGKIYWTQKGADNAHTGTIKRVNIEIPAGMTAANRNDVEVLFANLPEPIDMDLDLKSRQFYWTDRGDNTISRAPMDAKSGFDPSKRTDREILVRDLHEFIGLTLDVPHKRMYYTSLAGELGTAKLDGKKPQLLLDKQGKYTGIAFVPAKN